MLNLLSQLKPPVEVPVTLGYFATPEDLFHAAEKAVAAGFKDVDAITPYPIHGLDKVLKIPNSWIPYATLVLGLSGSAFMLFFQWWSSAVSYPLNVGGKPLFSWPAFAPITFEGGELLGGVTTLLALLGTAYICRPPALVKAKLDPRLTDDRFALVIPNHRSDDAAKANELLKGNGADEVLQLTV